MDLRFTERQEEFRLEARAWLEANVPTAANGRGPLPSLDTAAGFEAHRAWEKAMSDARWSVVSWPEEFGGRGVGLMEWLIFEEEYYRAGAPTRVSQNGIFLLAPTLFEFGTAEQQARFLPAMASGETIWCQGWSEPDAGSDLAGIRSRAERRPPTGGRGPGWVLNGQKTWCSRGAFADWLFGLFRTDPEAQKHRGLTYFLVPMDAPGVTVRPIGQLDGETGFAEVFFEDVVVPEEQVLGGVDQGWSVAMATAGSERGLSLRSPARYTEAARRLVSLYRDRAGRDPVAAGRVADEVARAVIDAEAYKLHTYWTASRVLDGETVGAEASMNKVFWSETDLAIHTAALALLGEEAGLLGDDGRPGPWLDGFLFALAGPIYAGTNEIQRNVVAERVLGLPRA
ncbi:MAG TPA: acyl-CoA dehydrogenase family protein [Acidimicrobiales bacterium]|nr:acyl-CoA dehydrogenase family protein [Acidimicrobiales bacterium]